VLASFGCRLIFSSFASAGSPASDIASGVQPLQHRDGSAGRETCACTQEIRGIDLAFDKGDQKQFEIELRTLVLLSELAFIRHLVIFFVLLYYPSQPAIRVCPSSGPVHILFFGLFERRQADDLHWFDLYQCPNELRYTTFYKAGFRWRNP